MICSLCGMAAVTWRGPFSNLTHTECSNCGGVNCQVIETEEIEDNEPVCPRCADWQRLGLSNRCPSCDAERLAPDDTTTHNT